MIKYNEKQIKEIESALQEKQADLFIYKRLQALRCRMMGMPEKEIIVQGVVQSRSSLSRICKLYRQSGLAGLSSRNKGGNHRKLCHETEAAVLDKLAEKAKSGQFVRVSEMQVFFESETGIRYCKGGFYQILRRHNWHKVVPRGRHPKAADEASCEDAKKLTNLSVNKK